MNFKIRNFKIQANYTAKVKVVRESPVCWGFVHFTNPINERKPKVFSWCEYKRNQEQL